MKETIQNLEAQKGIYQLIESAVFIYQGDNLVLSDKFKDVFLKKALEQKSITLDTYICSLIDMRFFKEPKTAKEVSIAISAIQQFVNESKLRKALRKQVEV